MYERVRQSPDFLELRRKFRSFVFPLTAGFLFWYLLYVVMSAWARGFMGHVLFGKVNVALVFGLLQFVSTFVIAWWYERYSSSKLDPLSEKVREEATGL
ncbi:DUF485 domain-containing protein [Actinocorallia longicatena]|uniref:DUF485 domain-containing protein n=2 Tax=Actinocorallia longicatena TaxID=111803 RepID=A0ABP6Q9M7_9ACTN